MCPVSVLLVSSADARLAGQVAFEQGVVLVRCPGCDNNHLIADRLGYFDDDSTDVFNLVGRHEYRSNLDGNVVELTERDLDTLRREATNKSGADDAARPEEKE